jgi:hypothetical protein
MLWLARYAFGGENVMIPTRATRGMEPRQAGAGPKMSTAFRPPNANEFDIV